MAPWLDLTREQANLVRQGRPMPTEEFKRRWIELEKRHGAVPWEKMTRGARALPCDEELTPRSSETYAPRDIQDFPF